MSTPALQQTPVKAVIFDFDGTIADSFAVFVRVIEKLLKRKQPLTEAEIDHLRQLPPREIMKQLGIKKWQLPTLIAKGRREVDKHIRDVVTFDGMSEVLQKLSASGYKLFIVSSHSPEGIQTFLARYGLAETITRVQGNVGLWAKPKNLRKFQRQSGFSVEECIYVGDEIRDIEAAAKCRMRCLAVGWGFHAPDVLRTRNPTALVEQPKNLIRTIENL